MPKARLCPYTGMQITVLSFSLFRQENKLRIVSNVIRILTFMDAKIHKNDINLCIITFFF